MPAGPVEGRRDPGRTGWRDDAIVLAAGAAVVLAFLAAEREIAGEPGLPLDDGWIHLRFARNLAAGRGFAINPGEPVAGSTAPLWTLLLAAALWSGLPGLGAAKVLGLAAWGAAGLLTRRLALALGLGRGGALVAAVGLVSVGRSGWAALSGMEVALAAALVAGSGLLAARGRGLAAAAGLGLATAARPEAALLAVLHVGAGRPARAAALRALVVAAILLPAVAFNLATVGRPVPATAAAKVEGGLIGWWEGHPERWEAMARRTGAYAAEWGRLGLADHPALPALGLLGLLRLPRGDLRWWAAALLLQPAAMALVAPYRGPAFQTGRYVAHLLPLATVAGAAGLAALLRALPAPAARRALLAGLALAAALGVRPAAVAYAWGVQNINAMQVRLGRWVATHTPPEARLAVNDVGALSYFGDRPILDLMGLVTPEILPYRRQGPDGVLRYLQRVCPDYLVIFPAWFPELAARGDLFRPVAHVRLVPNVVSGADEMVVYETAWNRWAASPRACPAEAGGRQLLRESRVAGR